MGGGGENESGIDHPFHPLVNPAQILFISGADSSYPPYTTLPAWKDTVLVPKWGGVTLPPMPLLESADDRIIWVLMRINCRQGIDT